MFRIFDIAGSAVSAQSQRLNVVASNLANADTVAGPDGNAYRARQVVFQTAMARNAALAGGAGAAGAGVRVATITEDQTPGRRVHDPKHPAADTEGYVTYSNVNPVEDTDADTYPDAFPSLLPGTKVCWDVHPVPQNDTVEATEEPQLYKAVITVKGDGSALDSRDVYFLIPPKPPMINPNG